MKTRCIGMPELVKALEAQQIMKRDMVVPSTAIEYRGGYAVIKGVEETEGIGKLLAGIEGVTASKTDLILHPLDLFDMDVAERLKINPTYFRYMREKEALLLIDQNVNYWMERADRNFLVRTFVREDGTGIARALLSDRFKVIDNLDILITALDAINEVRKDSGVNVVIDSCDLTDKRMYVRFICPDIHRQAIDLLKNYRPPRGHNRNQWGLPQDSVMSGFVIGNSEIGHGSYFLTPRLTEVACWNGLLRKKDSLRKTHIGEKMEEGVIDWSEETQTKQIELIRAQVRDGVKKFLSPEYLGGVIHELTGKIQPLEHPIAAVSNVCKHLGMSEEKKKDVLTAFMAGGDLTNIGVMQALTWYAHQSPDGDEQYEVEAMSMEVIDDMKQFDKPAKVTIA